MQIRNPNVKIRNKSEIERRQDSDFDIGNSDLFRILTFGFRIFQPQSRMGAEQRLTMRSTLPLRPSGRGTQLNSSISVRIR